MRYREHQPPPILAPWVACLWERGDGGELPLRVLPDGCIDIVWTSGAGTTVVGPNSTAFLVSLPRDTRVVGVRMRPGGAPPLLEIDPQALCDVRAPAADVLGDAGRRLADALDGGASQRATLTAALIERAGRAARPDPLVAAAIERMRGAATGVSDIADELAISQRQLRRRFGQSVGYGPKRLARVLRLWCALDTARAGDDDLARVAADAGYVDQSHLCHEFRDLAGDSPSAVLHAWR